MAKTKKVNKAHGKSITKPNTPLKRNFGKVSGSFGKDLGKLPESKKVKKTPDQTSKSQKQKSVESGNQESLTNPLRNKPVTARIVMGALSAQGPDDPGLKSLIRNPEDAEMATNLCKYLVAALEHYSSQPSSSQPAENPSTENQDHYATRPEDLIQHSQPENLIGGHDVHINPNMTLTRNAHAHAAPPPPSGEAARSSVERHAGEVARLQHEAWRLRAEHEREAEKMHALELRLREDHGARVRGQQRNEAARREECERAQRDNRGSGAFAREFQDRETLLRERFELAVRQHEEEDASIRRDHEGAMGAGQAAGTRIEELNRRAGAAGAGDMAVWEDLRADYSWALEEGRRVMEEKLLRLRAAAERRAALRAAQDTFEEDQEREEQRQSDLFHELFGRKESRAESTDERYRHGEDEDDDEGERRPPPRRRRSRDRYHPDRY